VWTQGGFWSLVQFLLTWPPSCPPGEYQDRRNLRKVDCSKTIWILATNYLDPVIKRFWAEHQIVLTDAPDPSKFALPLKDLQTRMKKSFMERFEVGARGPFP